jgi:hypothetical protein
LNKKSRSSFAGLAVGSSSPNEHGTEIRPRYNVNVFRGRIRFLVFKDDNKILRLGHRFVSALEMYASQPEE